MSARKYYSRVKIHDEFTDLKKANGKPMSRQQIHMMRKKSQGKCLTCGEDALGVYCLKHQVRVREAARKKLKYSRRLKTSMSYVAQARTKSKAR